MRFDKCFFRIYVLAVVLILCGFGCVSEIDSPVDHGIVKIATSDKELIFDIRAAGKVGLVELAAYEDFDSARSYPRIRKGKGTGEIKIARFDGSHDRLYSKYALVDSSGNLVGDLKYVTDLSLTSAADFKLPRPDSIKGVTCIVDIDDAIELGVKYVNDNVLINQIVAWNNPDAEAFWEFDGIQIPLNMAAVRDLDRRIKGYTDAGMGVFVVFINQMPTEPQPGNPLVHPRSDLINSPTHLGAFNVVTEEGLKYYLGVLDFLAARYTREDRKYGLISSMIVGNEIQQHWVWHNTGDIPEDQLIKDYLIDLRMAWLAFQKYHKDFRVYVSMDHHWTKRGFMNNPLREIRGDVLLEKIAKGSKKQGNFPWNVAFHPYPENLFEPRFWMDKSVGGDFRTTRITFKNLEVLPRFLKQPVMLYQGQIRDIALTEQGFHTPDGPNGEKIQAAAYAYAYCKVSQLPEISSFMLHRHVDHRGEGGLKLGLWNNEPLPEGNEIGNVPWGSGDGSPWKKKVIWEVFKYADTPLWEKYFEFAKPIVGITDWSNTPTNTEPAIVSAFEVDGNSIVYDFIAKFDKAQKAKNLCCEPKNILRAAGWMVPAIYQHPSGEGVGELTYQVNLPPVDEDGKLRLLFETILAHVSEDGVRFSIQIDGNEIWSTVGMEEAPVGHEVELTKWSGREVRISFMVDKIKTTNYDWSYWINPIIINR